MQGRRRQMSMLLAVHGKASNTESCLHLTCIAGPGAHRQASLLTHQLRLPLSRSYASDTVDVPLTDCYSEALLLHPNSKRQRRKVANTDPATYRAQTCPEHRGHTDTRPPIQRQPNPERPSPGCWLQHTKPHRVYSPPREDNSRPNRT